MNVSISIVALHRSKSVVVVRFVRLFLQRQNKNTVMKMTGKVVATVVVLVVVLQIVAAQVSGREVDKQQQEGREKKDNCVCMNWRNCHGSIDSE